MFGFIAEPVFAFIPESCSRSPGIAFTLPRNPHLEAAGLFASIEPAHQVKKSCGVKVVAAKY